MNVLLEGGLLLVCFCKVPCRLVKLFRVLKTSKFTQKYELLDSGDLGMILRVFVEGGTQGVVGHTVVQLSMGI